MASLRFPSPRVKVLLISRPEAALNLPVLVRRHSIVKDGEVVAPRCRGAADAVVAPPPHLPAIQGPHLEVRVVPDRVPALARIKQLVLQGACNGGVVLPGVPYGSPCDSGCTPRLSWLDA